MQWPHIMSALFLSFGMVLLYGYVVWGWFRPALPNEPPPQDALVNPPKDDACGPLRKRIADLEVEKFDLSNKLLKAEGEIWRLANELKVALDDAATWRAKYGDAMKKIDALENEIRRLLAELASCRAKLSEALSTCAAKDAVDNACTFRSANMLR
jgi:hypothetical protein